MTTRGIFLVAFGPKTYKISSVMSKIQDNRVDLEWYISNSPDLAEARENGVDLWALWANLQRSVAERLRRHQIALQTMRNLREAKKI